MEEVSVPSPSPAPPAPATPVLRLSLNLAALGSQQHHQQQQAPVPPPPRPELQLEREAHLLLRLPNNAADLLRDRLFALQLRQEQGADGTGAGMMDHELGSSGPLSIEFEGLKFVRRFDEPA